MKPKGKGLLSQASKDLKQLGLPVEVSSGFLKVPGPMSRKKANAIIQTLGKLPSWEAGGTRNLPSGSVALVSGTLSSRHHPELMLVLSLKKTKEGMTIIARDKEVTYEELGIDPSDDFASYWATAGQ